MPSSGYSVRRAFVEEMLRPLDYHIIIPPPKKKKYIHAFSVPHFVLFAVVLCGSVERELLSKLFKLVFHRCFSDFLGQLPFEWENTTFSLCRVLNSVLNTHFRALVMQN